MGIKARIATVAAASVPAAVLAIGLPFTAAWEGLSLKPYADIVGRMTVCRGETNVPMRVYTLKECDDMFGASWATYYKAQVKCYPNLPKAPASVQAMVTDLAYQNGNTAVCTARNFGAAIRAGDWMLVCERMKQWINAGGKPVRGIENRRFRADYNSYDVCVSGL